MMSDGFVSYIFKPQLKTVGPKYGKLSWRNPCSSYPLWTVNAAMDELKETGALNLDMKGDDDVVLNE